MFAGDATLCVHFHKVDSLMLPICYISKSNIVFIALHWRSTSTLCYLGDSPFDNNLPRYRGEHSLTEKIILMMHHHHTMTQYLKITSFSFNSKPLIIKDNLILFAIGFFIVVNVLFLPVHLEWNQPLQFDTVLLSDRHMRNLIICLAGDSLILFTQSCYVHVYPPTANFCSTPNTYLKKI